MRATCEARQNIARDLCDEYLLRVKGKVDCQPKDPQFFILFCAEI